MAQSKLDRDEMLLIIKNLEERVVELDGRLKAIIAKLLIAGQEIEEQDTTTLHIHCGKKPDDVKLTVEKKY